ncbi:MAG: type II toxin-antitoxin system antitoxin DNA ADP-ribosyl glycohydrolase DarG [Egibacteraceae bacterium]
MITDVHKGDLFSSDAQALVNTVNTVGVMGKGIALEFKRRFPKMFADYRRRCAAGQVQLGEPYLWRNPNGPSVVNFPTKDHWRSVSKLVDIERGLVYLAEQVTAWGVTSLAVPPLGTGNGRLDWAAVGPTLYRHLDRLPVPVVLYAPSEVPDEQATTEFLVGQPHPVETGLLGPGAIVIAEIVRRLHQQRHAWPVGRIRLQKLAYFATAVGVPTGLEFTEGSYGPFAHALTPLLGQLVDNGVLVEARSGRMLAVGPGPTFDDMRARYQHRIQAHEAEIERVTDLLSRLDTQRSETAANLHFAASALARSLGRRPSEQEVLDKYLHWKRRRQPPPDPTDVVLAIRSLAAFGWLDVTPSSNLLPAEDDLVALA